MLDDIWLSDIRFAGQTLEWLGEDSLERFEKNCRDPEKLEILRSSGWLDRGITYRFNKFGFRGNEVDGSVDNFCVFGDSVTFGTAMAEDWLYTHYISQSLGIYCNNFGVAGGSDMSSIRLAMTWIDKLKPKFVIYQKTFDHRLEWIEEKNQAVIYGVQPGGGGSPPKITDKLFQTWIDIDDNRIIMSVKNDMAMRWLCHSLNVPLFVVSIEDFFSPEKNFARDLLHPGPQKHREVAERLLREIINV